MHVTHACMQCKYDILQIELLFRSSLFSFSLPNHRVRTTVSLTTVSTSKLLASYIFITALPLGPSIYTAPRIVHWSVLCRTGSRFTHTTHSLFARKTKLPHLEPGLSKDRVLHFSSSQITRDLLLDSSSIASFFGWV